MRTKEAVRVASGAYGTAASGAVGVVAGEQVYLSGLLAAGGPVVCGSPGFAVQGAGGIDAHLVLIEAVGVGAYVARAVSGGNLDGGSGGGDAGHEVVEGVFDVFGVFGWGDGAGHLVDQAEGEAVVGGEGAGGLLGSVEGEADGGGAGGGVLEDGDDVGADLAEPGGGRLEVLGASGDDGGLQLSGDIDPAR